MPYFFNAILILYSFPHIGLQSCLLRSDLMTKLSYAFLIPTILLINGKEYDPRTLIL
jgi:hypothetical protein